MNVPFVPIIFKPKAREKEYRKGSIYVFTYIRLVENWNNWNKRAKPQVNAEKSCSNSKNGVGTGFSESRKDAGKHGKVLFQLFLEQTGTDPAILGVRLLPLPMRSGRGQKIF